MSIKFECYNCKQSLEAEDTMKGQMFACPGCNAAIEVPLPVLPKVSPKKVKQLQRGGNSAAPAITSAMPKSKMKRNLLIAVVMIAVVGAGGYFAYIKGILPKEITPMVNKITSVSYGNDGIKWSHSELIAHLKNKGFDFTASETSQGGFWGPAMYFNFDGGDRVYVYVQIRKTEQEAKDTASTKGDKAFYWGRFYFEGEPTIIAQLKQELDPNSSVAEKKDGQEAREKAKTEKQVEKKKELEAREKEQKEKEIADHNKKVILEKARNIVRSHKWFSEEFEIEGTEFTDGYVSNDSVSVGFKRMVSFASIDVDLAPVSLEPYAIHCSLPVESYKKEIQIEFCKSVIFRMSPKHKSEIDKKLEYYQSAKYLGSEKAKQNLYSEEFKVGDLSFSVNFVGGFVANGGNIHVWKELPK